MQAPPHAVEASAPTAAAIQPHAVHPRGGRIGCPGIGYRRIQVCRHERIGLQRIHSQRAAETVNGRPLQGWRGGHVQIVAPLIRLLGAESGRQQSEQEAQGEYKGLRTLHIANFLANVGRNLQASKKRPHPNRSF